MSRSTKRMLPIFLILSFSCFIAMIYLFFMQTNAYELVEEGFQIVAGYKAEYSEGTEFVYGENGPTYEGAALNECLDASPIYMSESTYIVIPEYSIYVNARASTFHQVACFTEINYDSGAVIGDTKVSGGFIFDGKSTYTFLEDMTLSINGESVAVGRFSTISISTNEVYSLYNKLTDTVSFDTVTTSTLLAECTDYSVDLLNDILYLSSGERVLLFDSPELLELLD